MAVCLTFPSSIVAIVDSSFKMLRCLYQKIIYEKDHREKNSNAQGKGKKLLACIDLCGIWKSGSLRVMKDD